jgi:hypothetical protein
VQGYAELHSDWLRVARTILVADLAGERRSAHPISLTITDSALNSWMAQEVRPIALDLR